VNEEAKKVPTNVRQVVIAHEMLSRAIRDAMHEYPQLYAAVMGCLRDQHAAKEGDAFHVSAMICALPADAPEPSRIVRATGPLPDIKGGA